MGAFSSSGRERAGANKTRGGEASQLLEQLVLEPLIVDAGGRLGAALVIPVAAGGARLRSIAGGQPYLGRVPSKSRFVPFVRRPDIVSRRHAAASVQDRS